jgi:DNA-binding CsgD family transcriptional regulator
MDEKDFEAVLKLIEAIHRAGADTSIWPSVVDSVARVLGGHAGSMVVERTDQPEVEIIYSPAISPARLEYYKQEIISIDETTAYYDAMKAGDAAITGEWFSIERMACYDAFYKEIGFHHFAAGKIFQNHSRRGWISVAREQIDPLFELREKKLLKVLLPHIQQSVALNKRLQSLHYTNKMMIGMADHLEFGVVMLADTFQAVIVNSKAKEFMRDCPIDISNGQVKAKTTGLSTAISKAFQRASPEGGRQVTVVPFENIDGEKFLLSVHPYAVRPDHLEFVLQPIAYCVTINRVNHKLYVPIERAMEAFGLTRREAEVLHLFLQLFDTKKTASGLGISMETFRTHFKRVLEKTKCRNQAELTATVAASLVVESG